MGLGNLTTSERAELALYRAIVALMPSGVALIRVSDATIVWVNDRLVEIVGEPRERLEGRPAEGILGTAAPEQTFEHPEFGTVWLAVHEGPVSDGGAAPVRAGTALPPRGTFQDDLRRELARARRQGTPLALAMLALDGELDIADSETIDLLGQATQAWRSALRDSDTIAYYDYGNLDYIALLPDCPEPEALAVTERARAAACGARTCSAGIAHWVPPESGLELATRAHRALRTAQHAGGNRAVPAAPTAAT
jgi:GGDEF domain-containing protein